MAGCCHEPPAVGWAQLSSAEGSHWSAHAHHRHTYATVLLAGIDSIRAHFGNPTQITLLRMPVPAGSLHEKQCIRRFFFGNICW
jgi:hypothetical protein